MKRILLWLIAIVFLNMATGQELEKGKQHFYYQRFHSAQIEFHQILARNPDNGEAWLWLVKSYGYEDDWKSAADTFQLSPNTLMKDDYWKIAKGVTLLHQNKKDSALQYFANAISQSRKKDADIFFEIADAVNKSNSIDASYAIQVLEKIPRKQKNSVRYHKLSGDAYKKMRDGSAAYKAYESAVNQNEHYAEGYFQMGKVFLGQQNSDMYVKYFKKAINADTMYAPAYFELFRSNLFADPPIARKYFEKYLKYADSNLGNNYYLADLSYLERKYGEAIHLAESIVSKGKNASIEPRIYKLLGYCYAEIGDTATAIRDLLQYIARNDTSPQAVDLEKLAVLYNSTLANKDSSIFYYEQAARIQKLVEKRLSYYKELAKLNKAIKDYRHELNWLGKYYTENKRATNVDLFNWGVSAYRTANYQLSDSIFAVYTQKYPEQGFGYYWRGRTNAAIDSTQEQGLAIPHYKMLIDRIDDDTLNSTSKKWMIEACSYIAAYETNVQKNYPEAAEYLDKILKVDPDNSQAQLYLKILEQAMKNGADDD